MRVCEVCKQECNKKNVHKEYVSFQYHLYELEGSVGSEVNVCENCGRTGLAQLCQDIMENASPKRVESYRAFYSEGDLSIGKHLLYDGSMNGGFYLFENEMCVSQGWHNMKFIKRDGVVYVVSQMGAGEYLLIPNQKGFYVTAPLEQTIRLTELVRGGYSCSDKLFRPYE